MGSGLVAGIVVPRPGKQPAQAAGDEYGGLRYPGHGQCQYEGGRSGVPQVRYYGMGRVRGVAGGVGDFMDDQYGGAQRAEDDERPHVQGRFSGQRRPGEFLDLLLLYEAAGFGVPVIQDGLSFCGFLVWMI